MSTSLAVINATVVTCDAVGTVLADQTIVVGPRGTITRIGPTASTEVPAGCRRIDASNQYVMPGLINAHAHLFSDGKPLPKALLNPTTAKLVAWGLRGPIGQAILQRRVRANATTQLHTGVTTIRTVGDVAYEVIKLRDAIESGEVLGPRLIPSGPLMAITGGHGAPQIAHIADTVGQARDGARRNLDHGAQAIKISATGGVTDAQCVGHAGKPEMDEPSMAAICEEAHAAGVLVAAHAQSVEGVRRALRAGVDTIEHGSSMDEETIALYKNNPKALRGWSAMIPTLQACLPLVKLEWSVTGADEVIHANAVAVLEEMVAGLRAARESGIAIGMGTDSAVTYVTHANTWLELDYLVRFGGMTTIEALNTATQVNARILGIEEQTGSVEVGKAADLIILDENPLDSLRTLRTPRAVIARGIVVDHLPIDRVAEVDAQLDKI